MRRILYLSIAVLAIVSCKNRRSGEEVTEEVQKEAPAVVIDTVAAAKAAAELPEEPVFDIVTTMGTIKVRLYKNTPKHRANFEKLALSGFYDSTRIHRVVDGFVIQMGDPLSRDTSLVGKWGTGGPDWQIPAEFVPEYKHKKGALAAARRGDKANPYKESSGSQFYLVQDPANCVHLDGEYTVFGETVAGLNVIDRIASVHTDRYARPTREIMVLSVKSDPEYNNPPALAAGANK